MLRSFPVLLVLCACAPSDEGGKTPVDGNSPFALTGWATFRSQLPGVGQLTYHSGFDGMNNYQVPLGFVGGPGVTFAVDKTSVAAVTTSFAVDSDDSAQIPAGVTLTIVLMRSLGTGQTKVTASFEGEDYVANLAVASYTPADVTLGQQRYDSPANANATDRVACNSCHATLNKHATAFLADLTDDEILKTAVEGVGISVRNPETGEVQTYEPNGGNHTWNVTAAERKGVTAYLRSRDPLFQLPTF